MFACLLFRSRPQCIPRLTVVPKSLFPLLHARFYAVKNPPSNDGECIKIHISKCPQVSPKKESKRFKLDLNGLEDIQRACCCVRRSFRKNPCSQNRKKHSKNEKVKEKVEEFKSMWETLPKPDPHPDDVIIRHDELFYVPGNSERIFQKTWNDCPFPQMRMKKQCLLKEIKPPPLEKRPRSAGAPKTASNCEKKESQLSSIRCLKIKLPLCRAARNPPSCVPEKAPSDCVKIEPPYPSFSECKRDEFKKQHPKECGCLVKPSICEVYEEVRRREAEDD